MSLKQATAREKFFWKLVLPSKFICDSYGIYMVLKYFKIKMTSNSKITISTSLSPATSTHPVKLPSPKLPHLSHDLMSPYWWSAAVQEEKSIWRGLWRMSWNRIILSYSPKPTPYSWTYFSFSDLTAGQVSLLILEEVSSPWIVWTLRFRPLTCTVMCWHYHKIL